jgi:phosphoesterase RecJ-like protein
VSDGPLGTPAQLAAVAAVLRNEDDFLVTAHQSPDADALGSLLAFGRICDQLGKRATLLCLDPVPDNLRFLPGLERLVPDLPSKRHDRLILLDCNTPDRVGPEFDAARPFARAAVLDHHLTEQPFGDPAYVRPSAAATGEIVVELAAELGLSPDAAFATCAYTAIVGDTGGFRFSNTTPRILRMAADLVAAGASPQAIAAAFFGGVPERRVRLLADALAGLELHHDGRVAMLIIDQALLAKHGANRNDLEGFIDHARTIRGVEVAVQLREHAPGDWRASLRATGDVNVERVAAGFGGGGHKPAAGCPLKGDRDAVRAAMLQALGRALEPAA